MILFFIVLGFLYACSLFRKRNELYLFDVPATISLKGLLSLSIIAFHIQFNTDIAFLSLFNSWGAPVVSIFLFISGYGLIVSYKKRGENYLNVFLKQRLLRILFPFLLVTFIYLGLAYLDSGVLKTNICYDLVVYGMTPLPYSWFVVAILVLYLVFYVVFKFLKAKDKNKLLYVSVISVLLVWAAIWANYERCWWVTTFAFCTGLFYGFYEDFFVKIAFNKWCKIASLPVVALVVGGVIVLHIEPLLCLAYIAIPLLVLTLTRYSGFPRTKLVMFLGEISYEIYLLHGIGIELLRGYHFYIKSDYLYVLAVYTLTIVCAYCLHKGMYYLKYIKV